MLVLTRKVNESIRVDHCITVSVLDIRGNQVRLGIEAPRDIPVIRTEIYESVRQENLKASRVPQDFEGLPERLTGNAKK